MGIADTVRKALGMSSIPTAVVAPPEASAAGLTPDYQSFRNTYWGQMQPVNYKMLWKIYTEDSVVAGCVNTLVDAIVGDGYKITIKKDEKFPSLKDDPKEEEIKEFLKKQDFNKKLRDIVTSLVIFGDAYFELVRAGPKDDKVIMNVDQDADKENYGPETVSGAKKGGKEVKNFDLKSYENDHWIESLRRRELIYKVVNSVNTEMATASKVEATAEGVGRILQFYSRDSASIRIDYNEHGEVIKYIQRVLHRRVDYYPDEMIHFAMNTVGGRVYGHSSLLSLVYTIQTKMAAEGYTWDFFKKGAMPRLLYNVANMSPEQVKRFKETLKLCQPQDDVVVSGGKDQIEIKEIAPKNSDMQFQELLQYLRQNIFYALQVPETLLGSGGKSSGGANRNQSQTHMEMFDRRKRSLKRDIADTLNNQFFTPENLGVEVEFEFEEENMREELKKAQEAQLLSSIAAVHPNEVRQKLDLPVVDDEEFKDVQELKTPPMQPGMAGPGGKFDNKNPNSANPQKKSERAEGRERQNVEQQLENKSEKIEVSKSKQVLDMAFGKDVPATGEIREEQGSISRHRQMVQPGEQAIAQYTDRERTRYPFGASANIPEPSREEMRRQWSTRVKEIMEAAYNPVTNAQSLNQDRVFPKDGNPNPQQGETPQPNREYQRQVAREKMREILAISFGTQTTWANAEKEVKPETAEIKKEEPVKEDVPTTATFYKGTDQMAEMERMEKVRNAKKKQ